MKKAIRILLCLAFISMLGGFIICATSPDNVFVGITVMVIGGLFAFFAIIPAAKLIQQRDKQK